MSYYWLEQTLTVLPLALWVYLGLGIPYALIALPRRDWGQKITVLALSFAFGPALLTAWMLILGVIGGTSETALIRFDSAFIGAVIIAVFGYGLVWWKWRTTEAVEARSASPLAFDERLLLLLIILAVSLRFIVTAYWSFTAYDALWVYGYQGRLYQMLGYIPDTIGYYPQFLPLQYTFMQLLSEGFDDHAARVVIPLLHVGSILATYVLGKVIFTRRTGIYLASIWTLYPHVAQWAHIGDLEIPLTFSLTLTMAFFLSAWIQKDTFLRRRYAIIAGLCFGVAMWTKPTGGAFIWGVILLVVLEFVRVKFSFSAWLPRFEVAFLTGLACIPLGGIWYLRNVLLGLPALVFPHESWLTRATRSGDLLSFPLFALLLGIAYLASRKKLAQGWVILIGVGLILAGAMPSSPLFDPARRDPPMSYLTWIEISLIISGLGLVLWSLRNEISQRLSHSLGKISWAYLLIFPYFITWFWSYSYHARLSFPIVPIMILPIAYILTRWLSNTTITSWHAINKVGFSSFLILLSIPSMVIPIFYIAPTHDWLWENRYPDDFTRTQVYNPGVTLVAQQLWGYESFTGTVPTVIAPGEQRLRFFLPYAEIITDTVPTNYEELEGATHYIYGSQARWRYENDEGILPLENRIVASLGREDLFIPIIDFESGTFEYELYALDLEQRYVLRGDDSGYIVELDDEILFGDNIQLRGYSLGNTNVTGNRIGFTFALEVLEPLDSDYHIQMELFNIEDNQVYWSIQRPIAPNEDGYYHSELWEVSEFIADRYSVIINTQGMPSGRETYQIVINFVDIETGDLLPVTINGEATDGYPMDSFFNVN